MCVCLVVYARIRTCVQSLVFISHFLMIEIFLIQRQFVCDTQACSFPLCLVTRMCVCVCVCVCTYLSTHVYVSAGVGV